MTIQNAAARRPAEPLAGRPERTLHHEEQTAMADQEILAAPEETAEDSGILGLNIYGNVGGNVQTVLSYTATGQVPDSLAWLTGNFTGTENMGIQIAQPWDNNGTLGLNIYGNVDGTLQPVFTSSDMDQGSGALAWLTGNFTGTGNDFTEIAQLWNDDGILGLIVYGSPAGSPQVLFTNPNMSQGSSALAFLAGNFTGSGTTEIAQLWDNNGTLGLIVYGIGDDTLEAVFANPNMNQSSSALAFLVGDFTGSGATEIAQLWDNNGTLGLIVYGIGNDTLEAVYTNPNMGQGSGALAFLPGYFIGSGTTTQIAQLWDNNGTLEMIVYGNVGNDNLGTISAFPMNQGSSALAFLTGNFIGSGYTQIAQTRDNNGTLQLLIYGNIGNGSLSTVFSNDISQIPNALAWVTGDFTGTGNTQILQPWARALA
jgi:hypothetical protein